MAFDEGLAERIRDAWCERRDVTEKRMFGGLAFMLRGHMVVGILGDRLMARVGPEQYPLALATRHVAPMDFTGRPMKGYVFVAPEGLESDRELETWLAVCERFNATLPAK